MSVKTIKQLYCDFCGQPYLQTVSNGGLSIVKQRKLAQRSGWTFGYVKKMKSRRKYDTCDACWMDSYEKAIECGKQKGGQQE